MIIYKITNKVNQKVYIGQTKFSLETRYAGHIKRANSGCMGRLYPAMRKYGIDNFECEEIDRVDESLPNAADLLNEKEIYWINFYGATSDKGYNILIGGEVNRMHSPLARANHAKKLSSEETRHNISNGLREYRKTHPFSELHRQRLSKAAKGNHNFGSGDTRSIECYCIDENGVRHDFHSYKDAGVWWFNAHRPFGNNYVQCTYQRKIIDSINKREVKFKGKPIDVNIQWFLKESDVGE